MYQSLLTLGTGWSLITGMIGYKRGGGQVKFYPYEKRGGKSFSHADRGGGGGGGAQKVLR